MSRDNYFGKRRRALWMLPLMLATQTRAELVVAHTSSGAEELARMIPNAWVVSAINTVPSEVLFGVYEAKSKSRRPSLLYCSNDERGKGVAVELIRDVASIRWTLALYESPDTPSRSRCSSRNSRTKEKDARSWLTGSSGLGNRRTK